MSVYWHKSSRNLLQKKSYSIQQCPHSAYIFKDEILGTYNRLKINFKNAGEIWKVFEEKKKKCRTITHMKQPLHHHGYMCKYGSTTTNQPLLNITL